jgi:7,8-dihydropterin-6-yl-methyl-4-(beta-D-ribofuranosyl)aminobenzene 5'-phosphate synthase
VVTTGPIPRLTQFESIPSYFAVRSGGRFQRDRFEEEQAIVITTRQGLVVLVGCSHRGVVNTLYRAVELAGDTRVLAVIGGTHLGAASQEQIEQTIGALRELDVGTTVACHCTGFRAAARLAAALGDRFDPGGVGYRFTL